MKSTLSAEYISQSWLTVRASHQPWQVRIHAKPILQTVTLSHRVAWLPLGAELVEGGVRQAGGRQARLTAKPLFCPGHSPWSPAGARQWSQPWAVVSGHSSLVEMDLWSRESGEGLADHRRKSV